MPYYSMPHIGHINTESCVTVLTSANLQQTDLAVLLRTLLPDSNLGQDPQNWWAMEQSGDSGLQEILQYISHGVLPCKVRKFILQCCLFAVVEGILHYVDPKWKNSQRIAVLKSLQQPILEDIHSDLFGALFSGQRMFNTLVTRWWWEQISEDSVRPALNVQLPLAQEDELNPYTQFHSGLHFKYWV